MPLFFEKRKPTPVMDVGFPFQEGQNDTEIALFEKGSLYFLSSFILSDDSNAFFMII